MPVSMEHRLWSAGLSGQCNWEYYTEVKYFSTSDPFPTRSNTRKPPGTAWKKVDPVFCRSPALPLWRPTSRTAPSRQR